MTLRVLRHCLALMTAGVLGALPAAAEITSISGSAAATVNELRSGQPADTESASDAFPTTTDTLPIQVVASLVAQSPAQAAGTSAAQFADPRTLNQENPEEFAINLALNSLSAETSYTGFAQSQELRGVLFQPGETGPEPAGTTIPLIGRLFIDGALAIFATDRTLNLTGAHVVLTLTVVKEVDGQPDQTVFTGGLTLAGAANGRVTATADGSFPTDAAVLSDLTVPGTNVANFQVLVLPQIPIDYNYDAVVGAPFRLRATIAVDAANLPGGVGVAAVLGTPVGAIETVLDVTQGQTASAKTLNALQTERSATTGRPAFAPAPLPFCGLLGFEALLGLGALVGLRRGIRRRRPVPA